MAAKSKSGPLRQSIGPLRARLAANVKASNQLVSQPNPTTQDDWQRYIDDLEEAKDKTTSSIDGLAQKDQRWHDLIVGLHTDEEAEAEEQLYQATALGAPTGYLLEVESAKDWICKLNRRIVVAQRHISQATNAATKSESSSTVPSSSSQKITAKLPKLTLPTFTGDYLEWQNFWSIFSTNVDSQSISSAEKFAYLKMQLKGNAETTIDGIIVNDENYALAIKLLKERFERSKPLLVSSLYSQLKKMPVATNKLDDLMATYDGCEKLFRQLENEGEDVNANRSLVLEVLGKYPATIIKELLQQYNTGSHSSLSEIRASLQKLIRQTENLAEVMENLDLAGGKTANRSIREGNDNRKASDVQQQSSTVQSTQQQSQLKTSAFAAATTGSKSPRGTDTSPQKPCYFCGGSHFNSQCDRYRTAVERQNQLIHLGRCSRCLSPSHLQGACTTYDSRIKCFFCKSTGAHVSPLCPVHFAAGVNEGTGGSPEQTKGAAKTVGQALLSSAGQAILPTASAMAYNHQTTGGGSGCSVRILFDTGSHRSYITERCSSLLGLVGGMEESSQVAIFGTERSLSVTSRTVSVDIQQLDGSRRSLSVRTIPMITCSPIGAAMLSNEDYDFVSALQIQLADRELSSGPGIDILIGSDYFWDFLNGTITSTPSGLHIIPSTLGLLVGGRCAGECDSAEEAQQTAMLCLTETFNQKCYSNGLLATKSPVLPKYPDIDEFWKLESIGIRDDPAVNEDDQALQKFNSTVSFDGVRYQVRWPWKPSVDNLPDNYGLALRRFRSLAKRLYEAEPEMMQKYNAIIEDQIKKGVIEKIDPSDIRGSTVVHYLPHHPIIKPSSKTTKVRIVYDASAKTTKNNPSLNECMFRGPVMLPDLCAVLIRFCCHPVAILADVEKAYLQIGLQSVDRDATRFLWFEDVNHKEVDGNMAVYRFCRVPFGVISSQFLLGATIQYHLNKTKDCVAMDLKDNTYVDNVASGAANCERAIQYQQQAKRVFQEAGMNLQQWCSNSEEFMASIPDGDKVKKQRVKVLGLIWDCRDDMLQLGHSKEATSFANGFTKRSVLQALASVFDPLGWFQPVVLPAKLLLQRLWEDNHAWDDELPLSLHGTIATVFSELQQLVEIRQPRFAFPCSSTVFSVVAFSDASAVAYAAAVYIRQHDCQTGEYSTRLVFSKCRLAPRKSWATTLPRLELLGAVIALRAAQFVRNAVSVISNEQPVNMYLFTDSQCVLRWLITSKPLAVFVDNRVKELQQADGMEFLYVPSVENPADFSTRGMSARDIQESRLWWHGPDWLCRERGQWPEQNIDSLSSDEIQTIIESELKKSCPVSQSLLAASTNLEATAIGPCTMEIKNYSSFRKLLRITVICLKFMVKTVWRSLSEVTKTRFNALNKLLNEISVDVAISRSDLAVAKILWLRHTQQVDYEVIFDCILRNRHHSLVKQLNLKLDDWGLLRCHGRFQHVCLMEAVSPVLLSGKNYLTELIVREIHEKLFHAGVGHTLCQTRLEYWVPKGRASVRRLLNKCVFCRRHKGSSFSLPNMPPWPRQRVSRSNPFQFTGLDYMGPINVKVGGQVQKMWICLFTCLAVRAIHLEYVLDCSAKQFLDCVVRFVGRRGTPEQIISDNAPQFRTVKSTFDKMWHAILKDSSVISYAAEKGISWKFTTELAPWQGGFYERLVGLVKRALKVVIGRRLLEFSEFVTLCVEVEAVVNTRPITYVYGDLASKFTLRPSDFLTDLPMGVPATGADLTTKQLGDAGANVVRYWKLKNSRLNTLWQFWQDEYLLSLRERGQMSHKGRRGEICATPRVGQVVLVKDTGLPRGSWKLARVTSLIYSADKSVRSAELQLPNKMVVKRSVNFLYPLEIEPSTNDENNGENDEVDFDGFSEEEVQEAVERVERVSARDNADVASSLERGLNAVAMAIAFSATK